jgi:hypothetical protein
MKKVDGVIKVKENLSFCAEEGVEVEDFINEADAVYVRLQFAF